MPVEPATMADLDRVADLWVELSAEQREHGSHLAAEANRAVMREALAAHVVDGTCLVAREGGADAGAGDGVVGFVSFALERDGLDRDVTRGVVHNLYVVPAARGRGVGGELLAAAEAALAAAGAERVVLEAVAGNEVARRFYEERGYERHRLTYERGTESATREGS